MQYGARQLGCTKVQVHSYPDEPSHGARCSSAPVVTRARACVLSRLRRRVGLVSRSVAGLPVLLRIGCDAQLACASRLSRFTLLGNDSSSRGFESPRRSLVLTPALKINRTGVVEMLSLRGLGLPSDFRPSPRSG